MFRGCTSRLSNNCQAMKIFGHHLWYFGEVLVNLAFFDTYRCQVKDMLKNLTEKEGTDETPSETGCKMTQENLSAHLSPATQSNFTNF